jgi:hypothetical protein
MVMDFSITSLTGDETCVSTVNVVETKKQSKQWMHMHSPNKLKKFTQTSACQKAYRNRFMGEEKSADGEIHATRDHNNFRSVLLNTKTTV